MGHLIQNLKPKVDIKSFISGRGSQRYVRQEYSFEIFVVFLKNIIFFKSYDQKDNICKYSNKTGNSTIPLHLNDNEIS